MMASFGTGDSTGGGEKKHLASGYNLNIDLMGQGQFRGHIWEPVSVFKRDCRFKKVKNTVSQLYHTHYSLVLESYDIWLLQKSNFPLKSETKNHCRHSEALNVIPYMIKE